MSIHCGLHRFASNVGSRHQHLQPAGDSQDTATYAVSPNVLLSVTDTLAVVGVNHNAIAHASHTSPAVYNAAIQAGVASVSQTNPEAVGFDKGTLTGSAEAVLRELKLHDDASAALKAALPKLYVSLIARDCLCVNAHCVSLQGTDLIPEGATLNMFERAYVRPGDTSSATVHLMLLPRMISGVTPMRRVIVIP